MLNNYSYLANSLKNKFRDIDEWPEIIFDNVTIGKLSSIPNVKKVNRHSIQFEIDDNQVIIPSQYVMYAVCIKELALKLYDHLELFEKFKQGKTIEDIGFAITNNRYQFNDMKLDEYSEIIAFSVFTNAELNMSAKSIINGVQGNFKIRSTSDFFGSVILKIINVPDASSAILGKLVFNLCKNPILFDYLEKLYLKDLPYVLKSNKIGQFVKSCIEFFIQYTNNNFLFIEKSLVPNSEPSLFSIKNEDYKLTSIFKKSLKLLPHESLLQGGKPRFFSEPIYIDTQGSFVYLSTEWTFGTNSRLDLINFILFIEKTFPTFKIEVSDGNYILKTRENAIQKNITSFPIDTLLKEIKEVGFKLNSNLVLRYVTSIITKPFVILTGLSGSGKTKLAQAFAMWITEYKEQYALVPVGADWTNREPLLGYPNSLIENHYVKPDSGVLDILLKANVNYLANDKDLAKCEPYFLILDEMNLSHVERYFADFLSTMESGDEIKLYSGADRYAELDSVGKPIVHSKIPDKILLPKNLFIIGTVNIDETTYMFSPKVLDRANTIEFRISYDEMEAFYKNITPLNMDALIAKGKDQAPMFMSLAAKNQLTIDFSKHKEAFVAFFETLQAAGAEFGYRTANEMTLLVSYLIHFGMSDNEAYDVAIMQKLLPKLHGSRSKLNKVLPTLIDLCQGIYPISLEKLERMSKNAEENGFASYAEA